MSLKDGKIASQQLASFGLKAHSSGVRLPSGRFDNLAHTLAGQWTEYASKQVGPVDTLSAVLYLRTTESHLELSLACEQHIPVLRLKPVVEALNAAHPGMGWLVAKAVTDLVADYFPVYTPGAVRWFAEYVWHQGCSTDEDLMEQIRSEYSPEEVGDLQTLEDFKDRWPHPWPSDFVADVEGHTFLFGDKTWPKLPTRAAARAFCGRKDVDPGLRACVKDALAALQDFGKKKHICSDFDHPDDGSVGSTALVVWDDSHLAIETVEHHEQQCYEASEGSEIQFTYRAPLEDDEAITQLVRKTKALVKRFALASRLLSHFPEAR